jgi:hypothetical protein
VAAVREGVRVSRRLPLESVALRVALLFLAVDTLNDPRRWTLGPLGAIELVSEFVPVPAQTGRDTRCFSAQGRLCAPDGYCVNVEIVLSTREGADPRLTLQTESEPQTHRDELLIAARAGLDELAEELLFFGTRQHAVS